MTDAMIGYDSKYEVYYSGNFVAVGEVIEISPGEETADRVDATHYQSPGRRRERIAGLIDVGTGTVRINWIPGSATDQMIRAMKVSGEVAEHRITFPNAETVVYDAVITGFSKSLPIDDRMTASFTFEVSGDETWST
jgi:predicted secreted protein